MGYSRKIHGPDGRHGFLTPPPPEFLKLLEPPLPSGFPSSPIQMSIKLLDTVILIILNVKEFF